MLCFSHTPQIEKLFEELQINEKTVVGAHNALICGTAKYLQVMINNNNIIII